MRRLIITVLAILLPYAVLCQEATEISDQETARTEIFSRIKGSASAVQTLAGEFTQERRLQMLEETSLSRGRFYYRAPDSMRWEVYEPVSMGFAVTGDKGKRWKGESGRKQSFDIKKEPVIQIISGQVFAWAGADFDRLEAGYDITVIKTDPVVLRLVPLSATEKKYLSFISLIFSQTEDYVSAIEIQEAGGDSTLITFHDMKVNEPIEEDLF